MITHLSLKNEVSKNDQIIAFACSKAHSDAKKKMGELSHILRKLPRVNLDTLQYLMDHLIR